MTRRIFLAINLPPNIKQELAKITDKLKKENQRAPIKWVEPKNLHLTLHFLGSLDEKQIQKVNIAAESIFLKHSTFEMELGNIGCFPDARRPRVIFIKAKEGGGEARRIQAELKSMLQKSGFETDSRPWQSHITLGRVKAPFSCRGLDNQILPLKFKIESIDLMESELTPNGPVYNIIKPYKLS